MGFGTPPGGNRSYRATVYITDPALEDNPVIYISGGFAALTGYQPKDVEGKNCRFLQGPETVKSDVLHIKEAIKEERDCNVHLLNHKKDGTVFANEFFLTTLKTPENDVAYFIGIQADAMESGLARRRKSGVGVAGAEVAEEGDDPADGEDFEYQVTGRSSEPSPHYFPKAPPPGADATSGQ
jgi:PAS domain S-box-containing protein